MSDHDPLDQALRHALAAHAGHPADSQSDPAGALAALRPRFRRARRRRRAIGTASLAAAAALVGFGVSTSGTTHVHVITPAQSTSLPPSSLRTTSIPSTSVPGPVVPTTGAVEVSPGTGTSASTILPTATPTSTRSNRSPGGPPAAPTSTVVRSGPGSPVASSTTTVPPPVQTKSISAPGGVVVVRYDSTVQVVSTTPAAGWTIAEQKQDDPARIEVRFQRTSSSEQSKVEARLQDGQLRTDVS
jgi:hypothetical protein